MDKVLVWPLMYNYVSQNAFPHYQKTRIKKITYLHIPWYHCMWKWYAIQNAVYEVCLEDCQTYVWHKASGGFHTVPDAGKGCQLHYRDPLNKMNQTCNLK